MTSPPLGSPSLAAPVSFATGDAGHLLNLSRQLRHLDTAVAATRQEFGEIVEEVCRLNPLHETPPVLEERLASTYQRLRDLEENRRRTRQILEGFVS